MPGGPVLAAEEQRSVIILFSCVENADGPLMDVVMEWTCRYTTRRAVGQP
jgi:hypothetical protein